MPQTAKGLILNVQHYSLHDGPGIRTTVFVKGCPLHCLWCANPESIKTIPQIGFHKQKCIRDYLCLKACPYDAVRISEESGFPVFDSRACDACIDHPCIEVCNRTAIELRGKYMSPAELWREVAKDRLFYRNSGGGVTLSGGEPTMQPEFTLQFFTICQEKGVHTALDTCGFVRWEVLTKILEHTDLILYDLKHLNAVRHKELTGVSNEIILANANKIASEGKVPIMLRMPIIPGYNDAAEDIEKTAAFAKKIGAKEITLLPYHQFGTGKYEVIGKKYLLEAVTPPSADSLNRITAVFQASGVTCLF